MTGRGRGGGHGVEMDGTSIVLSPRQTSWKKVVKGPLWGGDNEGQLVSINGAIYHRCMAGGA